VKQSVWLLVAVFMASAWANGQTPLASPGKTLNRPTLYIETQDGFESYLSAAISKKSASVDLVIVRTKAAYILRASPVQISRESGAGKIARCMFAYCIGIEDTGHVSVQLVEAGSSKVVWAYSVNKQRGQKNSQSMAEAVAKHLKSFIEQHNDLTASVPEAQSLGADVAPSLSEAEQQRTRPQTTSSRPLDASTGDAAKEKPKVTPTEFVADAARRMRRQHAACVELAKSNPSITCE
jgi:hypothetical protein